MKQKLKFLTHSSSRRKIQMTEENGIRREIVDSSVYTLIVMGNYRRADVLLKDKRYAEDIPNRNDYDGVIQDRLERGLD